MASQVRRTPAPLSPWPGSTDAPPPPMPHNVALAPVGGLLSLLPAQELSVPGAHHSNYGVSASIRFLRQNLDQFGSDASPGSAQLGPFGRASGREGDAVEDRDVS